MTDRDKLIEMMDNANIPYGFSQGNMLLDSKVLFKFRFDGSLDDVERSGGGYAY